MPYKQLKSRLYKLCKQPMFLGIVKKIRWPEKKPSLNETTLRAERKDLFSIETSLLEEKYYVSIILPTFNRARVLEKAIRSVLSQRFSNFELIVSDDGSTDNTAELIERISDPRVRYITSANGGVSAARNRAIAVARGNVLAFLDSDNTWTDDHLHLCLAKMEKYNLDAVYGILEMIDGASNTIGWRASKFNFEKLSDRNYIDLNVFVTRFEPQNSIWFDENIRRAVDWDYIIRSVRGRRASLAYFVSARYLHDEREQSRLTNNEYTLYTKIVRARNLYFPSEHYDCESVIRLAQLRVAVHICAPREKALSWGDYYYALAMQKYLNLHGYISTIVYADSPAKAFKDADINIAVIGRSVKQFPSNKLNIAWVISHPEIFTRELAARFRLIFSASPYFTRYLEAEGLTGVRLLQQASDTDYFHMIGRTANPAVPCVFVGSSKGVSRPFVEKLSGAMEEVQIIGDGWQKKINPERIISNWIDNASLPQVYRNSRVVLSEHWRSMRLFGILANRISDALATGAFVVSDNLRVPKRYIPDNLSMCKSISEATETIEALLATEGGTVNTNDMGVSFQKQVHAISQAIHNNVFSKPSSFSQPPVAVEINAALGDEKAEWYFVNVLLAHVHEEALETTAFVWSPQESNNWNARIRWPHGEDTFFRGGLEDSFYELSSALNDAAGVTARKRVVLDEKIWRIFSVGRKPVRNPRMLTILSDDIEGTMTRLPQLKHMFTEIRAWTPALTHRTVIRGGKSTVRVFQESTRSRIRHFLQDTASYIGFIDTAEPDARSMHALVAGGCYIAFGVDDRGSRVRSLLQTHGLDFAALDLFKSGGWETVRQRELPDIRDEYWSRFGDLDYPTFQEQS